MQLEQILSAAVAAVDVNGIEIESIPSPGECISLQVKPEINGKCAEEEPIDARVYLNPDEKQVRENEQKIGESNSPHSQSNNFSSENGTIDAKLCTMEEEKLIRCPDMPILIPMSKEKTKNSASEEKNEEEEKVTLVIEGRESNKPECNKPAGNITEISDNLAHPVEVSFFGGEDENIVITSQQALEMFESGESNGPTKQTCQNSKFRHNSGTFSKFEEMKIFSDKNFQMEFSKFTQNSCTEVKTQNEAPLHYEGVQEREQPLVEEVVEVPPIAGDGESKTDDVPKASTEIEVVTTDNSEVVEYTTLTPSLEVDSVSSAVSGALRTIAGNVAFHSPPPGATVDTTVDANGQFVVKVMGPGIDISIPNREMTNHMNNVSNISNFETISDKDILDAFNLDNQPQTFYPNFNDNATPNLESSSSKQDTPINVPTPSTEDQKDFKSLKRKRDSTPSKGSNQEEPNKKKHSSIIAALRESIFRSKARKIVNQLGKQQSDEPSANKSKENEKNEKMRKTSSSDSNENTKKTLTEEKHSKPENKQYLDRHNEEEHPGHNYHFKTNTGKNNSYHHKHCSHRKSYNSSHGCHSQQSHSYSPPPFRITSNTSKNDYHNNRHSFHSREHSGKHYYNKCQKRCCSPCDSMNQCFKNDCCAPTRRQRSPSCSCCRCNRSDDSNDSFMTVRPEDLPSILRKGCKGNGSPIVMLEPDALSNTDGDSLKVQLIYLVRSASDRRMPREVPSPHSSHSSPNIMPNSPECNGSCTSGYDSYSSHTTPNSQISAFQVPSAQEFSLETTKWSEADKYPTTNEFRSVEKSRPSVSNVSFGDETSAYLHKPIEKWSYADVIFFLMGACNELNINPEEVKFKNSDDGSILLRMIPSDFEVLAPGHGQRLYDHFINFKTQNYMVSSQNIQSSYYTHMPTMEQLHNSHPQHAPIEGIYSSNHYQPRDTMKEMQPFEPFPPNACNSTGTMDSSLGEYVPQGSQYMESMPDSLSRGQHNMPSAASKIFPLLHTYDEPISDPDETEEEAPPEPPKKRGPGRPPKPINERKRKPKKTGRLWEFIRNLLLDPKTCPSLLKWEDADKGIFRIVQSDTIANKWGMRKNNKKMNYEKLSRAMRYYYKAKIFEPVLGKRLVYKFGSNAKGWRPLNPNNPNFENCL